MGFVKDLFGGGENRQTQRSDPKDVTPQEFTALRGPVQRQLLNLFGSPPRGEAPTDFTADLSAAEQNTLNRIGAAAQPSGASQAGQNFLQQLISGGGGFDLSQLGSLPDIGAIEGGTPRGEVNPFLQQAIDAAQRPLIENFQDIVAPALRAQFTTAGQQIQGERGSSPFQLAAARAQSGLANALGDIGSELAFQDFAQRQQLGSAEFQQLRDLVSGQAVAGRGQDLQAQTAQRQQQLEAVSQAASIDRAQLDNLLASLEAQALPRLVEQLGIDRGLEEFRRREEQFLQALQIASQLSSPTVAQVTRGESTSTTSPNIFGSLFPSGFQGS